MTDILETITEWLQTEGESPVYAATVTAIEGSAVRGEGATMAVSAEGKVIGSVSGGCIEPALVKDIERLRSGKAAERKRFCPTDDEIFGAPSPCGGTVDALVYPLNSRVVEAVSRARKSGKEMVWGLLIEGPERMAGVMFGMDEEGAVIVSSLPDGSEVPEETAHRVERMVRQTERSGILRPERAKEDEEEIELFILREPAVPRLIVAGGSHIGEALCRLSRLVGRRTVVVDPREAFSQQWRFAGADMLLHEWPKRAFEELDLGPEDAVAAISHNERLDDESVAEALRRSCYYVGVLGGRGTQRARRERLVEMGFSQMQMESLHGPIGLDIGARSPEEIALSIIAEVVDEHRNKKSAGKSRNKASSRGER